MSLSTDGRSPLDEGHPTAGGSDASQSVSLHARRRLRYIKEFDGLRGLAAVFVVAVHLFMVVIPNKSQLPNEIPGTFVFMDLFFVLSGFLITALLLREQTVSGKVGMGAFYRRRALRLLPALYVLLVAHGLYAWSQGPPNYPADVERNTLSHAALYGLNFQMDNLFSPVARGLTQLWSLGVEEQFYLLWPIIVIAIIPVRRKLSTVVTVLVVVITAVVVHRWLLWDPAMATNTGWLRLYTHTDTRADSLLIGALAAYLWVHDRLPPRRAIAIAAWVALPVLVWFLVAVKLDDPFPYKGGFTLMAVAWAAVILACVETDWGPRRLFRIPALCMLGEVSYGIYLWHVPVQFAIQEHASHWGVVARVTAALAVTAAAVALSWFLVERPFLRWKDRLDRRELRPPAEEPADAASTSSQTT